MPRNQLIQAVECCSMAFYFVMKKDEECEPEQTCGECAIILFV